MIHKILFIGPQWLGSDARALCYALRKLNHSVHVMDPDTYLPQNHCPLDRVVNRVARIYYRQVFNRSILENDMLFDPDVVLVAKGPDVFPHTLIELKKRNRLLVNFYPDVSMFTHGRLIPRSMPLYDCVFTTKSYGIEDLKKHFNFDRASYIPYGYDPDLHYPRVLSETDRIRYSADVSFIGTWSPKKEAILDYLIQNARNIKAKVWGAQWNKARSKEVRKIWGGGHLLGDSYAIAINASKINLAILSEARAGASSGDKITSRTFNIPACGGFMLHERTDELLNYFDEGTEIACFSSDIEIVEKTMLYLSEEHLREQTRLNGLKKCFENHSFSDRARQMMESLEAL